MGIKITGKYSYRDPVTKNIITKTEEVNKVYQFDEFMTQKVKEMCALKTKGIKGWIYRLVKDKRGWFEYSLYEDADNLANILVETFANDGEITGMEGEISRRIDAHHELIQGLIKIIKGG